MGNELKTIVSADTSKFVNEFQSIGSAAKRVTADMKKFRETTDGTFATAEKEEIAFARSLGQLTTQSSNAKGQFKELKSAVENLTISYRSLTDEEKSSPFGQAMAQSIQELTERAGTAKDAIADINAAINNASSDTRTFDQIAGGMNTLISTVQVGVGALQAFGIKNKGVIEAMSRLQGIMAVTNGITTIQNNLQRQSALMQGIMAVQIRARAVAEAMATKGTKAATVAQTVFNAVANANPYVLLATAIIAVGTALVGFAINAEKAAEEEKKLQIQSEKNKKVFEQQRHESDTLGQRTGDLTAKYLVLQTEWKNLKTVGDKVQWIKDNQTSFNQLGLSINNVNDAYDYFVKNASKVINALKAIAEADAYKELYAESIKKREKEWNRRNKSVATGDYYNVYHGEDSQTAPTKGMAIHIHNEWAAAGITEADLYEESSTQVNSTYKLRKSGIDKINKYRQDEARKTNKELKQSYDDEVNYYQDKMTDAADKATQAQLEANMDYNPHKSGGMSSHGGGTTTSKEEPVVGSLAYTQKLLTEAETKLNTQLVKGTDEWKNQLRIVNKLRDEVARLKEDQLESVSNTKVDTASEFRNPDIDLESGINMKPIWDDMLASAELDKQFDEARDRFIEMRDSMTFDAVIQSAETLSQKIGGLEGQWISFAATAASSIAQMIAQNAQLIASAQAAAMANGAKSAFALPFPANLAAWATTFATLIGIWASLPKFASGGIVGGSSYYGDRLTARVNSGEMILNKRQQSNLFSMINSGNALGGGKVEFEIRADRLIGVQKNYNRKQSKF